MAKVLVHLNMLDTTACFEPKANVYSSSIVKNINCPKCKASAHYRRKKEQKEEK